ncbi:excalibur calcium-binding domain-containing protein [Sphingomonas sp. 22176]|uniref:excalibur calcium-binding domain-containing protein n=1 Tax=Sphingomonas sp. 22176 TaxID=3453884 RepID=UPI003F857028
MRIISAKAFLAAALCGLIVAPVAEASGARSAKARRVKGARLIRSGGARGSSIFANCAAARAAGAAPIRVGDPGYSRRLDRDGDGVACER